MNGEGFENGFCAKWCWLLVVLVGGCFPVYGAMQFQSCDQPAAILLDESFAVTLEVIFGEGEKRRRDDWEVVPSVPYVGICLPVGWTVRDDSVQCSGVYSSMVVYNAQLTQEQELVSPAPWGYIWWVGRGVEEVVDVGTISIEIVIQTDEQVGRFSLDYMLGDSLAGVNQQRCDDHEIEVLADAYMPGGLSVVVEEELVHLDWGPPYDVNGLVGYILYRDGQVITESFVTETSYVEEAPLGGLHTYKVAAFYNNGDVNFGAEVEYYVFLHAGGSGTASDPFLIATARQLIELVQHPGFMDQYFRLVSDINLDPNVPGCKVFTEAVMTPDISEMQLGFQGPRFTGVFDGNGHTIRNLTIEGESYLGLFGALGSGAKVIDVNLADVHVVGNGWNLGAIAGTTEGKVYACCSSGFVMGYADVGGLIGSCYSGDIRDCSSTVDLVGIESVGGIVGSLYVASHLDIDDPNTTSLRNTTNNGSVFGWHHVGGLVGFNQGDIFKSSSSGFVNGSSFVGGLVGFNDSTGMLHNCYSHSPVLGEELVGGLVGWNTGSVSFTYCSGTVWGVRDVGGLAGAIGTGSEVTSSFWDMDTTGQLASAGGTGVTSDALQKVSTYVDAGWDFAGESQNGTENIWYLTKNGYAQFFSFRGAGIADNPYLVESVWHLTTIGLDPNMFDKHFKLTQSINLDPNQLGSRVFTEAVIAADVNAANDSFDGVTFSGVFDGGNNEIQHLTIQGAGYQGLFGYLDSRAQVSDLYIVNAHVECTSHEAQGILAGVNEGTITNCLTSGIIEGSDYRTGGLIGLNDGLVETCCSMAEVQGEYYVGGLIGDNANAGQVLECYSKGTVFGSRNYVGGLIGRSSGQVYKSYCNNTATSERDVVGGLIGANHGGEVSNCYSTGEVAGRSKVGGLVGSNGGTVSQCYSIGAVAGIGYVGGLVGWNDWRVTHSFWNTETSGQSQSAGGLGMTTAQMHDINTYLSAGWDFYARDINGKEDVWIMNLYPIHYPIQMLGQGTKTDPYLISNDNALPILRNIEESSYAHYRLTEDIDLAAIQFSRAIFPNFSGTFDGNGFAIYHLTITGDHSLGLFGVVGSSAKIMNLAVVEANIQGTGGEVGGVAGINEGYIIKCSSLGTLSGTGGKHYGGLVGMNLNHIEQCFSDCSISHDGSGGGVGGLVGRNRGVISNCYSTGAIEGRGQNCGGLTAFNTGRITNCYSTTHIAKRSSRNGGLVGSRGNDGEVHDSFWDIESSAQESSTAGIGLTTAEMQMASTFLDAGWDFINETINGTEDIWWIDEGKDYPRLWWEVP